MKAALLAVQIATYLTLGALLTVEGEWRLGASQLLLAAVQALIYL